MDVLIASRVARNPENINIVLYRVHASVYEYLVNKVYLKKCKSIRNDA